MWKLFKPKPTTEADKVPDFYTAPNGTFLTSMGTRLPIRPVPGTKPQSEGKMLRIAEHLAEDDTVTYEQFAKHLSYSGIYHPALKSAWEAVKLPAPTTKEQAMRHLKAFL